MPSTREIVTIGLSGIATCVFVECASAQGAQRTAQDTLSVEAAAAEVSRRPFSAFRHASCPQSASCSLDFGTVRASHRREITYVSCYVVISNPDARPLYWRFVQVEPGMGGLGSIELRPNFLAFSSSEVTFNASESAFLVVPAGRSMAVSMSRGFTSGAINALQCTVSGYDVTLQ